MCWWAPQLRKLRKEHFPDFYCVCVGYSGREVFYRDFSDEYLAFNEDALKSLGAPNSGFVHHPETQQLQACPEAVFEMIKDWLKPREKEIAEFIHITPSDIQCYTGQGCTGNIDTINELPYGEYILLNSSEKIREHISQQINFPNQRETIAVMPRLRYRGQARDGEDWNESGWREFLLQAIKQLNLNIVLIGLPSGLKSPGALGEQQLGLPEETREFVKSLHFEGPESVESQIALLQETSCSVYGGTGAATLAFFAGTPVFTMQSLENGWRFFFEWQKTLTQNHQQVKIFSQYPMGEQHFNAPPAAVFESFRQFYQTKIKPSESASQAIKYCKQAEKKLTQKKFQEVEKLIELALTDFPTLVQAKRLAAKLAEEQGQLKLAQENLQQALNIDSDDPQTVIYAAEFCRKHGRAAQGRKLLIDSLRRNPRNSEVRQALLQMNHNPTLTKKDKQSIPITLEADFLIKQAKNLEDNLRLNLEGVESSYAKHKLGSVFYSLARSEKPTLIVELGTYMGYSSLHLAAALKDNNPTKSELHLIDLWNEYPYRHCSLEQAEENFRKNQLLEQINTRVVFKQSDAFSIASDYQDSSIDLLHIDISNDGNSLKDCLELWEQKIRPGGLLLFEGGSSERDQVEWMKEYGKTPISDFIEQKEFSSRFEHCTLQDFPSLTIARKLP